MTVTNVNLNEKRAKEMGVSAGRCQFIDFPQKSKKK